MVCFFFCLNYKEYETGGLQHTNSVEMTKEIRYNILENMRNLLTLKGSGL